MNISIKIVFCLLSILGLLNNIILFSKPSGGDLLSLFVIICSTLAFLILTVIHIILLTLSYMRKQFRPYMFIYSIFVIINMLLFISPGILGVLKK